MMSADEKKVLRATLRERVKNLPGASRAEASVGACALLLEQAAWQEAKTVLLFAPLVDEPDVFPLIAKALALGKMVALPRFDLGTKVYVVHQISSGHSDLERGQFGILEPRRDCQS